MAVIFDLDQTLIDTSVALSARSSRDWSAVYKLIPQMTIYDGISELIEELHGARVPMCIVTSSPSSYCSRVIKHCGWPIDKTVCYHDTVRRKPFPDPILAGIRLLQVDTSAAVAIGDDSKDIAAARAAGVFSVATMWGSTNRTALLASDPGLICKSVSELAKFLRERYM